MSGSTVENDKAVAKVKYYDGNGKQVQTNAKTTNICILFLQTVAALFKNKT